MPPPTISFVPSRVRRPFALAAKPFTKAGAAGRAAGRRVRGSTVSGLAKVHDGTGAAVTGVRERLAEIPWPLITAAAFSVLYIGWIAYSTAVRGADAGLGVLVSWPVLILAAAIVTAPLAGIVFLALRVRDWRRPPERLDQLKVETITDVTFPS